MHNLYTCFIVEISNFLSYCLQKFHRIHIMSHLAYVTSQCSMWCSVKPSYEKCWKSKAESEFTIKVSMGISAFLLINK